MHLLPLVCLTLAAPSEPEALHAQLLHATAWVRAGGEGVGAGWVVDVERRLLVTNLHVVGDRDRIEAFFVEERNGLPLSERDHYLENQKRLHEAGRAVNGKVIRREPTCDLALVELEKVPPGVVAPPLAKTNATPGESVQAIGHRQDSEALWNSVAGTVRQVGPLTDGYFWRGKKLAAGAACLIVQLPIQPGDSGGPVVNAKGEVVGVLSGLRGPQATIAIQVAELKKLLGQANEKRSAPGSDVYRRSLPGVVWVRPTATDGRGAGWVIDRQRKLILTTNSAAGSSDLVDVVFPRFDKGELVADAASYADRIGLRQGGSLVRGLVLERDPKRDLALIELERLPEGTIDLSLAEKPAVAAQRVQAINHPSGVEHLWLHATGGVGQTARVELSSPLNGKSEKVSSILLQLPIGGSSGGPVVNEAGEVVGVLAAKEGAQQIGYALTAAEVRAFLDAARGMFDPKTAAEHARRAKWLTRHDRAKEALGHWQWAVKLAPDDRGLARALAVALLDSGDGDGAIERAKKLATDGDAGADDFACLAFVLQQLRMRSAAEWAEKAIAADKECALAYAVRGAVEKRPADLDKAIELAPDLTAAYILRAESRRPDDDRAIDDWSRAVELDPYNWHPLFHRSLFLLRRWNLEKNDHKRAIADLERLNELLPGHTVYLGVLAGAWLKRGDEEKAIEALVAAARWGDDATHHGLLKRVALHAAEVQKKDGDVANAASWAERSLRALLPHFKDPARHQKIEKVLEEIKSATPERFGQILADLQR